MIMEELFEELKKNKNNPNKSKELLKKINEFIENKEYTFTNKETDKLYLYMLLCNKYEVLDTLNKLINDIDFIKMLDSTNMDGSIIIALTENCLKPRYYLLKNSKKIKNSILRGDKLLNTESIIEDLTAEEMKILREDLDIDNYLISRGISFSTLTDKIIKKLMSDVSLFNIYDISTINEFANNYKNPTELVNNELFMNIYLSKLTDEYFYSNQIFKYLTIEQIDEILSKFPSTQVILHLIKDTTKGIQQHLLENKKALQELENCSDEHVLLSLPRDILLNLLSKRKNLLVLPNITILEQLTKKDLEKLFKLNKDLYQELLNNITILTEKELTFLINSLPPSLLRDFCNNDLTNYNNNTLINLLNTGNEYLREFIIKSKKTCDNIINSTTLNTYDILENLIKAGAYTEQEIAKMISNISTVSNTKVINNLLNLIPHNLRETIYDNNTVRKSLLKEEVYELDEYSTKKLLSNLEELKEQSAKIITKSLPQADIKTIELMLSDDSVLAKIFKEVDSVNDLLLLANTKRSLLSLFNTPKIIKYYSKENIKELLKRLTIDEKIKLCTNDLIYRLLENNEEAYEVFKKLNNKNKYLLNTINFDFLLIPEINKIKISTLEVLTKYPEIQDNILRINKTFKIVPNFINLLMYNTEDLDIKTINKCLSILKDSSEGVNRKIIGNIPKMLSITNYEELSKEQLKSLISYLLYQIPRYINYNEKVKRPIIIETPSTFNDILDYENRTEDVLTSFIQKGDESSVKNYFIQKHFKLTEEEASIMLNMYSIERIDSNIYKKEYQLLSDLNKIMNTDILSLREMDNQYKVISMYDSFVYEKQIKEMYGKIFNYEIRTKPYQNNAFIKNIYGKEVQIYNCPNDFLFLISNMNISKELIATNSYFESWHNTLNNHPDGISTSLISNDNFVVNNDILFGFYGILDSGINRMSASNISANSLNNSKDKYMVPRELIDNTRDSNNTIVIDKFALRPNYNNSNIPNIEPDFILVDYNKLDDNQYLELISRISEEFKTKRNKNGLPIIAYNIDKIVANETSKLKNLINKYTKNYDMNILASILNKLENNYTAYNLYNKTIALNFDIKKILSIVIERISKTNSISELNYLEELFIKEYNKFKKISSSTNCNYDLSELQRLIKERRNFLNK